jgi:hypothetical protein
MEGPLRHRRPWYLLFWAILGLGLIYGLHRCQRFWQVDACLDSGGRWNYEVGHCEH